ncbi:MAG: hypothetical protein A7316_10695 [Candidatus Altiarchaeales archaeon WOR_SM1_86-2]|nr:MAG: hypothetical protein A7316_10695 [Candidatus Altiarchaeales archaeon WOR_SM1_86-2]
MDNPKKIFKDIKQEGYKGIQEMIKNKQEENIFLDFKEKSDPNSPSISKEDKKNYAKALSGFSNLSGGVIIWGVKARKINRNSPDVASEEKPISYLKKFLTDLNSLTGSAIIPLNPGILNIPIYKDETNDIGFIATYIPESQLTPHRALLGRNQYYTRCGDSFQMMEHSHLEDAFGRRQKPKLTIFYSLSIDNNQWLRLTIGITNEGKYLAKYPCIRIKIRSLIDIYLSDYGVDGRGNFPLPRLKQSSSKIRDVGYLFAGDANVVIHPLMSLEVVQFISRPNKVDIENLKSRPFNEEYIKFEYELFAERCKPSSGVINITVKEVLEYLKKR